MKQIKANRQNLLDEMFATKPLINALGCQSVVNLPVTFEGVVIGTVNCLDVAGHYTAERVTRLDALAPLMAMAVLGARLRA
jgi:GAF domain-containing protein